jgi:phosphatidylserine/phosphatidylglycerophosphate/cardiolipin synthase-like enzyme
MKYLFLCLALFSSLNAFVTSQNATVYFSPDDELEKRLISMIEQEQKSVRVAIYCMTHRGVAAALIDAKKRGVDVEIIVDRFSVKLKAPLAKMVEAGIPVYVWDPDSAKRKKAHRPLMHNKFCVFGDDVVWTGSFNFTYEASRMHQENAIVFKDATLASAYKNQFSNIRLKSCTSFTSFIAANNRRPKSSMR